MAEGEGFEPPCVLPQPRFSRPSPCHSVNLPIFIYIVMHTNISHKTIPMILIMPRAFSMLLPKLLFYLRHSCGYFQIGGLCWTRTSNHSVMSRGLLPIELRVHIWCSYQELNLNLALIRSLLCH